MTPRDVWRPDGNCIHTEQATRYQSLQFVCNASLGLVFVHRMNSDCSKQISSQVMTPEKWQRIKRGECLLFGTAEQGNDAYSQLNTSLPTSYGVGCAAFPPPPRPVIGDQAGVSCPSGSTALGLSGGRRLELNVFLPGRFGELFAKGPDQPYNFCTSRVSVTLENNSNM